MMRAVVYARYSSTNQRAESIEDQIVARRFIAPQGWSLVRTYEDRAMSGASRFWPGYQDLLAVVPSRRFDVVISTRGRRMNETSVVYGRITTITRVKFGHAINPHLFRDDAATSIATEDPSHVHITAKVLGHSTLKTSERFYNQARGLEAGRRYHATIRELRGQAKSIPHVKQPGAATRNSPYVGKGRDKRGRSHNGRK